MTSTMTPMNIQKDTPTEIQEELNKKTDLSFLKDWYKFYTICKLCELCASLLNPYNIYSTKKDTISDNYQRSSRQIIIEHLKKCSCCDKNELILFLRSVEAKEQIDFIYSLLDQYKYINTNNRTLFNYISQEDYIQKFENDLKEYKEKYMSYNISSDKIIGRLKKIFSSFDGSTNLEEVINDLKNVFKFTDSPYETYQALELFPCSSSENFMEAKESFEGK
jgi:hypothetical protein